MDVQTATAFLSTFCYYTPVFIYELGTLTSPGFPYGIAFCFDLYMAVVASVGLASTNIHGMASASIHMRRY
ncbi:hypothetical protein B0H67DRAFT_230194 [Lasiosphaeris hirsuta]|uniref:Uncharacterized protein n=1 Tax=Lasiosphaeris hirsuta TaxID=260670 RepID=A0AA40DVG1_9PEZI|nr:hypothetical protein B0H67DRAFT_230194 [Lasiosphaeris hirsuta]